MEESQKKIRKNEILGFVVAAFFGPHLHFAYEWLGKNKLVGLVAAVNESTWEHLKLGFWPLFFWGIFEYYSYGRKVKNFFIAKAAALYSFCVLVPAIFYTYSGILGKNILILDILTFFISAGLGQFIGYKVQKTEKYLKMETLGKVCIFLLLVMFFTFTLNPPKIFLFKDPVTGGYGFGK